MLPKCVVLKKPLKELSSDNYSSRDFLMSCRSALLDVLKLSFLLVISFASEKDLILR